MFQVLHGHTTPETAYIVTNYPFGRQVRCLQRYWVETAAKGAKKDQQRMVSQTSHMAFNSAYTDKIAAEGQEAADAWAREMAKAPNLRWNAPKGGIYSAMVVMYLAPLSATDDRLGVHNQSISLTSWCEHFASFKKNFADLLDDERKAKLALLERVSRKWSPQSWAEFDAKQAVAV